MTRGLVVGLLATAFALSGCGGSDKSSGIPPVTTAEGVTIATGLDAVAFRKAQAFCSSHTVAALAELYGVRPTRPEVESAVVANEFSQHRRAARQGCGNGGFASP